MAVSAIDTPVNVIVSQNGVKGEPGTNGIDGVGFSAVRKSIIDNPLTWLYKKNNLVNRISNLLTVVRAVAGSYTDIYGTVTASTIDTPREEADGWLITSDETDTFEVTNNIPNLDNGFSCVLEVGAYLGGAVSQNIIVIPATAGDLFSIGTNASGDFVATLQGSDTVQYVAVSTVSAAVTVLTTLIAIFDGDNLNLYIDDVLAGTIVLPTGTTAAMALTTATINGNFSVNMRGLRFYDIILNSDEITYLS
tara:strand:- start:545 stop:1294 length:750 start_codon:yes stop_codon:yes gene_type:complete